MITLSLIIVFVLHRLFIHTRTSAHNVWPAAFEALVFVLLVVWGVASNSVRSLTRL